MSVDQSQVVIILLFYQIWPECTGQAPKSQGLAAESLNILPGNQPADCQENSLPAQARLSGLNTADSATSRLVVQVAGGSDQLRDREVV